MHILPVDPIGTTPRNYTIEMFKQEMGKVIKRPFKPAFVAKPNSTRDEVLEAFANPNAKAVAFVGHSVLSEFTHLSSGFEITDGALLIPARGPQPQEYDRNFPVNPEHQFIVPGVTSSAPIIFLGTCNASVDLEDWLGIHDTPSEKRALVVSKINPLEPPTAEGNTTLGLAARTAWMKIVEILERRGMTIKDAVDAANDDLNTVYVLGDPNDPELKLLQFQIIGNMKATIY